MRPAQLIRESLDRLAELELPDYAGPGPSIHLQAAQMAAIPDDSIGFTSPGDSESEQWELELWIQDLLDAERLGPLEKSRFSPLPEGFEPGGDYCSMGDLLAWVAENVPQKRDVALLWKKRCETGKLVMEHYRAFTGWERARSARERAEAELQEPPHGDVSIAGSIARMARGKPDLPKLREAEARALAASEATGKRLAPLLMVDTLESIQRKHSVAALLRGPK